MKLLPGQEVHDMLCEKYERVVHKNNCVFLHGKWLQIPEDKHRRHYVKVRVKVHHYPDGSSAIFHGPRKLASYTESGELILLEKLQKQTISPENDLSFIRSLTVISGQTENRTNHVL